MEVPSLRTVPRLGELPSPSFEEGVAPEYAASPPMVAFFFGSGVKVVSPLELSAALPFLLGEPGGPPLGASCQSPLP